MTLQDVADKLTDAEVNVKLLPDSAIKDDVLMHIAEAYRRLYVVSGDLLEAMDELQDHTRQMRADIDSL